MILVDDAYHHYRGSGCIIRPKKDRSSFAMDHAPHSSQSIPRWLGVTVGESFFHAKDATPIPISDGIVPIPLSHDPLAVKDAVYYSVLVLAPSD